MYNRYASSAMLQLIKGYKAYHLWVNYGSHHREFTIQDLVEPMEEIPNLNKTFGFKFVKTFRSEEEFRETANSIINAVHSETPNMQTELVKGLVDLIDGQDNAEQVFKEFKDWSESNRRLNCFSSWKEFSNFIYGLMDELHVEQNRVEDLEQNELEDDSNGNGPTIGTIDKCLWLAEKCMELSIECMKMAQELRNQP